MQYRMISLIGFQDLRRNLFCTKPGRPRHQQPIPELTRLWYLIWISKKYELETRKFLECFLDAWINKESSYNGILIQCRQKTKDEGVFLVTKDLKVITQLRLTEATLKHMPEVDVESLPWDKTTPNRDNRRLGPVDMQIRDIGSRVKWVNLKAKVVEKSITRTVFSRRTSDPLSLSTSTISDGTGSIKMPLWNAQIGMVSSGDMIQIENGKVGMFRGELQVSIGKTGRLTVIKNKSK